MKIERLLINYLNEPNTVRLDEFSVSWCYELMDDFKQKSFQIVVKNENGEIVYNTPVIESDAFSYLIKDIKLNSHSKYFVNLKTKDNKNNEFKKETSFYTTISKKEWLGSWIGCPTNFAGTALDMRYSFIVKKEIKKAFIYCAGLGYCDFYVNGDKFDDSYFNPGFTGYNKTVLYKTYDVTNRLVIGENSVGFEIGYGWYGNRQLLMQGYIEYIDGELDEIHSQFGNGWVCGQSSVISNSVFGGETYDATIDNKRIGKWSENGDYRSFYKWMYVIMVDGPVGELVPQEVEDISVCGVYDGELINKFENNYVYKFPINMAGITRITVTGKEGNEVIIRHAEGLKEDGHIDQLNLRSAECTTRYILSGKGIETYSPHFTFMGFQYCEVEVKGDVEIIKIEGLHLHNKVRKIGEFKCSNEKLNKLHEMIVLTEENNEYSLFSDCPQRDERLGWLNDLTTRAYQFIYNFDVNKLIEKVTRDIVDTQVDSGAFADTAPYTLCYVPADPSCASFIEIGLVAYIVYNNVSILEKYFSNYQRWIEYFLTRQKDYIVDYYYYCDWVIPESLKNVNCEQSFVASMFLIMHLALFARVCKTLNKDDLANHYENLANESRKALHEKYFNSDGYYGKNTPTENAMAIELNICPKEYVSVVYKNIVNNIIDNDYHLGCGNQGYKHALRLLCENDMGDLAIKVLTNPSYPGWGFMLENGSTTVWERWEKEILMDMNSFDHPMFGSYDHIFYRYFAGISFKDFDKNKIIISPKIPSTLDYVNCSVNSVKGKITSNWIKKGDQIIFEIEVPSNTICEFIYNKKVILSSGKHIIEETILNK